MRFFYPVALIFVLNSSTSSASIQNLRCHFTSPGNSDQLIVHLNSTQTGDLAYVTGTAEDSATSASDGTLALKRIDVDNKGVASFSTQVSVMQMTFKMPSALLTKPETRFTGVLASRIEELNSNQEQDLDCEASTR